MLFRQKSGVRKEKSPLFHCVKSTTGIPIPDGSIRISIWVSISFFQYFNVREQKKQGYTLQNMAEILFYVREKFASSAYIHRLYLHFTIL